MDTTDIYLAIRKVAVLIRTGVDPDRYKYFCHPEDQDTVIESLKRVGIREGEFDLFNIHTSEVFDPGQVVVADLQKLYQTYSGSSKPSSSSCSSGSAGS